MTSSHWRRLGALFVGVVSLVPSLLARPAGADAITDKRAEAAKLAGDIDRLGNRVSALDERYDQARIKLDATQQALAAARAKRDATQGHFEQVRARLQARAVDSYTNGGTLNRVMPLMSGDGSDMALRREYIDTVAGDDRQAMEDLHAARDDLDAQSTLLQKASDQAKAAQQSLDKSRKEAATAQDAEQAALGKVQGELGQLVADAQAKAAAAAEAQAKAQFEARATAERAAAAARADQVASGATRADRNRPSTPAADNSGDPPVDGDNGPAVDPTDNAVGNAPPASSGAAAAVAEARRQIGKPYSYGSGGPNSFDCSGLTSFAWRAGGVDLPHSSGAQYSSTTHVPLSDIQPGDLIFFGRPIHHVGIYVGGGQMIEAPHSGTLVRYASIYRGDLVGVGRPR